MAKCKLCGKSSLFLKVNLDGICQDCVNNQKNNIIKEIQASAKEEADAILKEAIKLGYKKVYLKTELDNYYEKFGAKYIKKLNKFEKLYCFELIKKDS